jgi:acetyl esterase/lipase
MPMVCAIGITGFGSVFLKRTFTTLAAWFAAATLVSAQQMGPRDVDRLPSSPPTLTAAYGKDVLEVGDLRLPAGKGPFPVVVVIHGGCWTRGFATKQNTAALATELTKRGYATWNIEYRQVGDAGGGWPGTFVDWAAATDYLRAIAKTQPIDLKRVSAVGHSAGAHASLWLAARPKLSMKSEIRGADPLPIHAAVAIDGPGDLARFVGFDAEVCGQPVIVPLMGGTPSNVPQHYVDGTPADHFPIGVPQTMIASNVLTPGDAEAYRRKGVAAGDSIDVVRIEHGGHFNIIAPGTAAFEAVEAAILKALQ